MIDPTDRPVYGSLSATPEPVAPRRRSVVPWLIAAMALAFAVGLLANPWFERAVRGRLPGAAAPADTTAQAALSAMQARLESLEARTGSALPPAVNDPAAPEDTAGLAAAHASTATDLAALEAEIAELRRRTDSSLAAASEGAERAQAALLVAALRRAVETGRRFDAYVPALRERFGASHPTETATLVAFTQRPVSAAALGTALGRLAPTVAQGEAQGRSWWSSFRAGLAGIVTVRRADQPAADAQAQLRGAVMRAEAGDIDAALRGVTQLPADARRPLGGWAAEARRLVAAEAALEALEVAALAPAAATPPPAQVPAATTL